MPTRARARITRPTKFLREFMGASAHRRFWHPLQRPRYRTTFCRRKKNGNCALQHSNVAAWLLMEPTVNFVNGLSAVAIDTYEQCPLRFKLERDWNLPRDVSASLHYGAAMHRVLHTFYDAQRYGREIGDEQLLENFRADLATAGIADRYQYDLYLRQGREQLAQFLEWARSGAPSEVLQTEQKFDLTIAGTKLTGRIDRMDRVGADGVAIVDYKTGKPKSQEDADKSLQLSLYALAAKEAWGMRADRLIFHNLEDNSVVVTKRDGADLEAAKIKVHDAAENIAAGNFPPNLATSAAFAHTGISVRRPRRSFMSRRRKPAIARRTGMRPLADPLQKTSATKTLGTLIASPWLPYCSCLVLFAAFLLCFLFGCHGSILPFHSSWNLATVVCCN